MWHRSAGRPPAAAARRRRGGNAGGRAVSDHAGEAGRRRPRWRRPPGFAVVGQGDRRGLARRTGRSSATGRRPAPFSTGNSTCRRPKVDSPLRQRCPLPRAFGVGLRRGARRS
jgi:hypothetical protein